MCSRFKNRNLRSNFFFDNTKNNDSLLCWYGDLTMPNIPTAMTMVCGTGAAWERKLEK